jgi:hypothetical protein
MQNNENKLMAENTSKEISHHSKELESAVHKTAHIPAWVIAKLERSSTDLSDVTHYLDGDPKFAQGGGIVNLDKIKNNIGEVLYKFIGSLNKEQAERMLTDLKAEIEFELKTQSTSARYSRLIDEQNLLLYRLGRDNELKMAKGGGIKKRIVVVLDEGYGKVINDLYNQWNNVKTKSQYDKWVSKVRKTKFGTYGTIPFEEVLKKFNFDNAPINSFHLKTFKAELKSALNTFANGGGIDKNLPVGQRVSSEKINKFIDYVYGFYGKGGIYARDFNGGLTKAQIIKGVNEYLEELDQEKTWGGGDSLDRERVREYLESKKYAQGGEIDEDEKYELAEKLEQDVTSYIADKKGISEDEAMAIIQDQNGREYFIDTISFTKDVKSKWSKIVQNLGDEFISINDDEDFSYENGGEIEEEGVNLFEEEDNIPPKVMAILDKYSYAFMDGEFEELHKCRKQLEKIGYTMDVGMGGEAMNLRKIGQKPKYADGGGVENDGVTEYADWMTIKSMSELEKLPKVKFKGDSDDDFYYLLSEGNGYYSLLRNDEAEYFLESPIEMRHNLQAVVSADDYEMIGKFADGGGVESEKKSNKIISKKVSLLLKLLEKHYNNKDSEKFSLISEKIHDISDSEGMSNSEYEVWDDLRAKMNEYELEQFLNKNNKYSKGGSTTTKQQKKIGKVMHEFKEGDLKTSAGTKVTNPKQAVAIALSEAGVPKKGWGHKKSLRK